APPGSSQRTLQRRRAAIRQGRRPPDPRRSRSEGGTPAPAGSLTPSGGPSPGEPPASAPSTSGRSGRPTSAISHRPATAATLDARHLRFEPVEHLLQQGPEGTALVRAHAHAVGQAGGHVGHPVAQLPSLVGDRHEDPPLVLVVAGPRDQTACL